MNAMTYLTWLIVGTIGTILFIFTMIIFGKLIKLQMKIWFLAKRGYHLIEHVGTNKVRSYFYLKPVDNKFEFKSGFYVHYPETTTKTSSVIPKTPRKGYSFLRLSDIANEEETKRLYDTISKLVYDTSAVTLKWGIPIITYVGNSPYPVNFAEPEKQYGAQVIRDIYIRLLATEQFSFMKKMITIGLIIMAGVVVGLVLLYLGYSGSNNNLNLCLNNLNGTAQNLVACTKTLAGNSTIVI